MSFTDLDQGREILSIFSFPKSMKHSVESKTNSYSSVSQMVCRQIIPIRNFKFFSQKIPNISIFCCKKERNIIMFYFFRKYWTGKKDVTRGKKEFLFETI